MAVADTISGLPWAVKPLYGFITDSFPICGMRRRPYLILAGLTGKPRITYADSRAIACKSARMVPWAWECDSTAANAS